MISMLHVELIIISKNFLATLHGAKNIRPSIEKSILKHEKYFFFFAEKEENSNS